MDRRIDQAQIRVYFFLNQNSIKQVAMGSFKSNCIVRREKAYLAMLKENILNMQIVIGQNIQFVVLEKKQRFSFQ